MIILRNTFLTQIHADCTQIHVDFSDDKIRDHLRYIRENPRLRYFLRIL